MNNKVSVVECIPKEFFQKEYNESFILKMMTKSIGEGEWVRGDVNLSEPDYFWNDIPFEFKHRTIPIPVLLLALWTEL